MLVDGRGCVDGNSWYGSTLSFQQCDGQPGPELDGWENDSRIFFIQIAAQVANP
jgi:hypothetical protein